MAGDYDDRIAANDRVMADNARLLRWSTNVAGATLGVAGLVLIMGTVIAMPKSAKPEVIPAPPATPASPR